MLCQIFFSFHQRTLFRLELALIYSFSLRLAVLGGTFAAACARCGSIALLRDQLALGLVRCQVALLFNSGLTRRTLCSCGKGSAWPRNRAHCPLVFGAVAQLFIGFTLKFFHDDSALSLLSAAIGNLLNQVRVVIVESPLAYSCAAFGILKKRFSILKNTHVFIIRLVGLDEVALTG